MKKLLQFGIVLLAALSFSLAVPQDSVLAVGYSELNCTEVEGVNSTDEAVEHCEDPALSGQRCPDAGNCELIKNYVQPFLDFLAAFVGVAVVIAIIYGGIQYASSGGDPQKAAAGKKRIFNAVLALVTFFFFYAFLNFVLLPGALE